MKEVKQYICECCGVLYADKVKAQECERNHKSAINILYQRFLPKKNEASGYPISITVKMADGKEVVYKR
jgi:hypothetical protein